MDYKKKDGTIISEEWMEAISSAADVDELKDTVIAAQAHDGCDEDYAAASA